MKQLRQQVLLKINFMPKTTIRFNLDMQDYSLQVYVNDGFHHDHVTTMYTTVQYEGQ